MEIPILGFFARKINPSPVKISSQIENMEPNNDTESVQECSDSMGKTIISKVEKTLGKDVPSKFLEYTDSLGEHVFARIERTLGKGATSKVFEIKDNLNHSHAVKKLDPDCKTEIKNELSYLILPTHEGLVKSHGVVITEKDSEIYYSTDNDVDTSNLIPEILREISKKNITRVLLFQPKMGIDLRKFQNYLLDEHGSDYQDYHPWLTNNHFQSFILNILSALEHLHLYNIIHRDLKPENIVYNPQKDTWCLTDFGLSREVPPIESRYMTPQMVTLWYRSLSILENSTQYGTEIDLFSLGCVALEILSGEILFPGQKHNQRDLVRTKVNWGLLMSTESYYTKMKNKMKNSQNLRIPREWINMFLSMLYEKDSKSASEYKEDFTRVLSNENTLDPNNLRYKKMRTSPTSCLSFYSNSNEETFL